MIPVPRAFQYQYQRCYSALMHQLSGTSEYARVHCDLAASQYVTYLEARAELSAAIEARGTTPGRSDMKDKAIRALRRQCVNASRVYANTLARLTADLREARRAPPLTGDALATMANGSGLSRPDKTKKKDKP